MLLAGIVGAIGVMAPVLQAKNLADSLDMLGGFRLVVISLPHLGTSVPSFSFISPEGKYLSCMS